MRATCWVTVVAIVGACRPDQAVPLLVIPPDVPVLTGATSAGPGRQPDLIAIGAGERRAPALRCPPRGAAAEHTTDTAAFSIDRRAATPDVYDACVAAGACPPSPLPDVWKAYAPEASLPPDGARAFCAWRGGMLPSYAQWQAAAEAGVGDLDPRCARPWTPGTHMDCEQTTRLGFVFRTRNSSLGEWLRDLDCTAGELRRIEISLVDDRIDRIAEYFDPELDHGAVRCVFAAQPASASVDTPAHDPGER